ncbi:Transcription initiation factor IIE, alpha subunit [Phaffia rhodozyma]|uniref:Transcription initiation factor IIE, alpha subunit n=1 Tax=Phaffia rhodozyma TaxID=264483 RepID=A0A0F7SJM8_PHARH|nr:Transcription initiation factor IIE, alpha subunit [Phaffia rhodozyma]
MSSTHQDQDLPTLKIFVQTVSRAFYDAPVIILLDQLIKKEVIREDELASMCGIAVKELSKLAAILLSHRLIKSFTRNEHREGPLLPHARPLVRTYYWIEFKEFSDVVRWRMDTLYKSLDKKLRSEQENKGYICPNCRKTYLPVDVPLNFSPEGHFLCDVCGFELVDNEDADSVKGQEDAMARFNSQTAYIQEGLRKTAEMVFPFFDIKMWLAEHAKSREAADSNVQVQIQADGDEDRLAKQREQMAAQQRSQNSLPAWHLYSTVSGQQTALGIAYAAEREKLLAGLASTLDDSQVAEEKHTTALEDYYQKLHSGATPTLTNGETNSAESEPTYQDSAETSSKRRQEARSSSLDPDEESAQKRIRTEYESIVNNELSVGGGEGEGEGEEGLAASEQATEREGSGQVDLDERLVTVDGVAKPFGQVTEEDQELMTPDEYTAYFEIWQLINS